MSESIKLSTEVRAHLKSHFQSLLIMFCLLAIACSAFSQSISKLTVTPNPATGNGTTVGEVTLTKPAASAGLTISLSSSNAKVVQLPKSVTVAAGSATASFQISTGHVVAVERVTIEGKDPAGKTAIDTLTVDLPPVRLEKLSVSPASVAAASSTTGTITLTAEAPTGGFSVNLTCSKPCASSPATVTIAAGAKTGTFSIPTSAVVSSTPVEITAADTYGYQETAHLTVELPTVRVVKLSFSPTTVLVPSAATGTVTLSEVAPTDGFIVKLNSSTDYLVVPKSVTIAKGKKTATFSAATGPVPSATSANVTASDAAGYSATSSLTVNPPNTYLRFVYVYPTSIPIGGTASCNVQLSGAAPAGGYSVTLSTMQGFIKVPVMVTVPAGSTSGVVTITGQSVSAASSASVTATDAYGYTASGSLSVTPNESLYTVKTMPQHTFSPVSITVPAGHVVTWSNPDVMAHTVTADVTSQGISSGPIGPNQMFCWTVPASAVSGAVFYYHCIYHGFAGNGSQLGEGMAGMIVVK